jgi:hypothetical protein
MKACKGKGKVNFTTPAALSPGNNSHSHRTANCVNPRSGFHVCLEFPAGLRMLLYSSPSEGKLNNLPHVPNLGHVKEPNTCSKLRGAGKIRVFSFFPSLVEASCAAWCGAPLEMKEGTISGARVQSAFRLPC